MDVELTIKNYRCFPDTQPVHFTIRDGFTAFVGANNSGKSSLLKFLYELRPLFQRMMTNPNVPTHDIIAGAIQGQVYAPDFSPSVLDYKDVFCDANDRNLEIDMNLVAVDDATWRSDLPNARRYTMIFDRQSHLLSSKLEVEGKTLDATDSANLLRQGVLLVQPNVGHAVADLTPLVNAVSILQDTLYVGPFRNALNLDASSAYYDITIGQSFIQTWRSWKSGVSKDNRLAARKLTDDIRRIFRFQSLDIDTSDDMKTLLIDIDGRSYMLPELGSGLTQFILVLAQAAVRRPSFILIDEPELNLHPSLQIDFLMTLGSYANKGVIFTTHSVGLARAIGNLVYSFKRSPSGMCEMYPYQKTPALSEFLGELGFSGYQELGCDKVLLVEGVTEVATLQVLLRKYGKDHQIVTIPMGGDQFINKNAGMPLQELKRITPQVSVLIDSERKSPTDALAKNRQDFVAVCEKAGVRCHVLDYRAIENYFPESAIKRAVGAQYQALGPYQSFSPSAENWGKSANWRIAQEMEESDLQKTDLGTFLQSL